MKKLKINKKIVTVATYTIAILCAINFAIYPGTNAIFKKDNDRALAYETNLKDVYKDSIINPDKKDLVDLVATNNEKTTPTNAVFGIPFKIDDENKGIYRIDMSNTKGVCTVLGTTDATPINLTLKEIENSNPKDYYLTPINESVTTGTVYVSCPVAIDDINYKIKLYEHVETKVGETIEVEDEFLYASSELVLDYNAYQSQFNDLYDEFWEQLVAYLNLEKNQAILEEFNMYTREDNNKKINYSIFKEFLKYYSSSKEDDNYNPAVLNSIVNGNALIPGITGSKETTQTGEKYTFNFEDSFIGLVKTYIFYNNPNTTRPISEYAYFSADIISASVLNKTIEYMFKTNGDSEITIDKEQESINLLYDYIKSYTNKDDNFTIADIKSIVGTAVSKTDHQIFFYINILDNAYNYLYSKVNHKIRISYFSTKTDTENYGYETFENGLDFTYGSESILTKSLKASLYSLNIYPAITSFDKEYPTYYEIHQDDAGNLKLVKVEINKEDNCKYVYISDLNDNPENDIVKTFINQYIADKNITDLDIVNIANSIPGLELKTANYPTDSTNAYNFITLNSDFMTLSDMYLNGISQEEMLKLIDKDSASLAANLYSEELINSIITNITKVPDSTLYNAINTPGVKTYYEAHYDEKNKKLVLISVSSNADGTSTTKIETMLDCFNDDIIENKELIESIAKNTGKTETTMIYLFITDDVATKANDKLVNEFKKYFNIASIGAADDRAYYEDVINKDISYSIYDLRLVASKIGS